MQLGTVARLFRYPVKSMRGEELAATPVGLQGMPGDRRYAFVQAESRSPFPWLTGRQIAALLQYRPEFMGGFTGEGKEPSLQVHTPDGANHAIDDPALRADLERRLGKPIFLLQDYRGNYDVAQVSLFSLGLAEEIGRRTGVTVDPRRFRANIYMAPNPEHAVAEAELPGRIVAIGPDLRLAITERDERCMMITLDPDTVAVEPRVLRTVAQDFDTCAGLYTSVLRPGVVRVGDAVTLLD